MAGPTGVEPAAYGLRVYPKIAWKAIRSDFRVYLDAKRYCEHYVWDLMLYLDRYFVEINSPTDIMRLFAQIKQGQRHLWAGFRAVFNFLEATGFDEATLTTYRKALPTYQCGIDLNVPEEPGIIKALNALKIAPPKYIALYNLLIDSGLRLVEGVKVIEGFKTAEKINDFYRVAVGEFRGSKQAYYAYLTEPTYQKIIAMKDETFDYQITSRFYRRRDVIRPKYLRKFAFDKMVELEVPESVADFIEGRVPKRIGAKHYMVLRRQADKYYGKYVDYLTILRANLKSLNPIV